MDVRFSPDPNNPNAPIGFPAGTVVDYKGECGYVKVDCGEHKIYLSKTQSPALSTSDQTIDCGRAGLTHNGIGTVGGPRSGNVVKDGLQINIPGMGDAGGGKWFHTAWWRPGQMPNGTDSSKGCIHISPNMLKKLKTCDKAPLEILNATNGGMNPVPFSNDNDPFSPGSSN